MLNQQTHKKENHIWLPISIGIFVVAFGLGFFTATAWEVRQAVFDESGTIDIARVINLYSKTRSEEVAFDQFWEVWNRVKQKYVEQPVDEVKLFYGSIAGLVQGLGDPHSIYLPPPEAEEFAKDLAGEFEGIGAEIGIRDNQLTIIAPLPESPAERAGLLAGDKIFAIDGTDTAGLTVDKAVSLIRGPGGTTVTLTISHNGLNKAEDIKVVREKITIPTVVWKFVPDEDKIAHLRVSYFNQDTWPAFDKAVREILRQSPRAIVLDLRSNPGGFLETAIDVASEWIEEGLIVRERMSGGETREHNSRGAHRLAKIPAAVLVDKGTASGSEIVAGALQDYKLAQVIGEKTFGKGSVQDFEVLPDGSALKLTIARWFTPNDRGIDGDGIEPDILVEEMFTGPGGAAITTTTAREEIVDVGLAKAVEVLKDK